MTATHHWGLPSTQEVTDAESTGREKNGRQDHSKAVVDV